MSLHIVADSSCDLFEEEVVGENFTFATVPFSMRLEDEEFLDDSNLDVPSFLDAMESCLSVGQSSCPDPQAWMEEFQKSDEIIAVTISSNLSGSFNSALLAKNISMENEPERMILVLDSLSTGPALTLVIRKMAQWAAEGLPYDEICKKATAYLGNTKTVFALCSYENLIKNGRMNKLVGFVAKRLSMWGIGIASKEGTIAMRGKAKGQARALKIIIEDMVLRGFNGGDVSISHCMNPAFVESLKAAILERWADANIMVCKTRGLDTFYAERGGLIVSYH